jgi:hypothetical protein
VKGNVVGITVTPVVAGKPAPAPSSPVATAPSTTAAQPVVAPAPTSPSAGSTPVVTTQHS